MSEVTTSARARLEELRKGPKLSEQIATMSDLELEAFCASTETSIKRLTEMGIGIGIGHGATQLNERLQLAKNEIKGRKEKSGA